MLRDFIRQINAQKSFKIKDTAEFVEFDDISKDTITPDSPVPDQVEIWAAVKLSYDGEVPERYKTLNFIIGDWVEEHEDHLIKIIHGNLKKHFDENYPNTDTSEIETGSTIWLDQLDYMPRIDDDTKSIIIEIELIMDSEPLND